ncbi:MAG: hypothetical protein HYR62_00955 [Actinobacteria bacterium]|nr:hypothetical protein [Actinomycetota bacterium]
MTAASTPPAGRGPADRTQLAYALREARLGAGLLVVATGLRQEFSSKHWSPAATAATTSPTTS